MSDGFQLAAGLLNILPDNLQDLGSALLELAQTPAVQPLVFAHRGGSVRGCAAVAPENSLEGFRLALAQNVDALEFDLQMTADGHLVVHHNYKIKLPQGGEVPIPSLTLDEVSKLRVRGGSVEARIPRFEEVVELTRPGGHLIVPELKNGPEYARDHPALDPVETFFSEVERLGCGSRTLVQAFHDDTLRAALARSPKVPRLKLFGLEDVPELLRGVVAEDLPGEPAFVGVPMLAAAAIGRLLVSQAAGRDRKVVAWREGRPSENPLVLHRVRGQGVHAVMVDDADRCRQVFASSLPPDVLDSLLRDLACLPRLPAARRFRPGTGAVPLDFQVVPA